MIKTILAAVVSLGTLSYASAAPVAPPATLQVVPDSARVIQVQHHRRRDYDRRRGDDHRRGDHDRRRGDDHRRTPRWMPGHHYNRAPAHWHRYHSRPRDWRRRGCVVVGPFWFCP